MSDYNGLGRSEYARLEMLEWYGLQGPFGGLWGSMFGRLGGLGAAASYGPDADGWYDYMESSCPQHKLCQFKGVTGGQWVGYARDLHPEFNVANLKWRLTGIGKETP